MKKGIAISLILWAFTEVHSQEYRTLRATMGVGLSVGILIFLEPSFRFNDKFCVGYRLEGGGFYSGDVGTYSLSSSAVTGQYYLFNHEGNIRFFTGIGVGTYYYKENYSSAYPSIGFFPRIGWDNGHFTLCFDYNIVNFKTTFNQSHMFTTTAETNRNYLSIKFGFTIGGGRKNK